MLASLITGTTKFDYLEESTKKQERLSQAGSQITIVQKYKNLLVREMYRVYESLVRFQFSSSSNDSQVDDFLRFSFKEKVPMHLMMLFSEDRSFIEKLFDPSQEFVANLINQDQKSRRYIKRFLDFIDPFTQNSNIRSLLRQALGVKSLTLKIQKVDRNPEFMMMEGGIQLSKCISTITKPSKLKTST